MSYNNFIDGSMRSIHFGSTIGAEINDEHFAIIFNIKSNDNMIFCVPLTSPKLKHFLTEDDFNKRNYLKLKYPFTYYIKETDSIALIDQMRTISIERLRQNYVDKISSKQMVLSATDLDIIKIKIEKFMESILHKKQE